MKKLILLFSLLIILLFPLQTKASSTNSLWLDIETEDETYNISLKTKTYNITDHVTVNVMTNNGILKKDANVDYDFEFVGKSLPFSDGDEPNEDGEIKIRPSRGGTFKAKVTVTYYLNENNNEDSKDDDTKEWNSEYEYFHPDEDNSDDDDYIEDYCYVTIKVKPMKKMYFCGGSTAYNYRKGTFTVKVMNFSKYPITILPNAYANCDYGDQFDRNLKTKKIKIKAGQAKKITFKVQGRPVITKVSRYEIFFDIKYRGKKHTLGSYTDRLYLWTGSKWKKLGKLVDYVGKLY